MRGTRAGVGKRFWRASVLVVGPGAWQMLRCFRLATGSVLTYRLGHDFEGETQGLSAEQLLLEILRSPDRLCDADIQTASHCKTRSKYVDVPLCSGHRDQTYANGYCTPLTSNLFCACRARLYMLCGI